MDKEDSTDRTEVILLEEGVAPEKVLAISKRRAAERRAKQESILAAQKKPSFKARISAMFEDFAVELLAKVFKFILGSSCVGAICTAIYSYFF